MPKIAEGQLGIMQMASYFSRISHSVASSNLRSYVAFAAEQQANYPDQLPRLVDIQPTMEADSGKIISSIA